MTRVQETKHSKIFYIHKPPDAFQFIKRVLIFILFEQPLILELVDPFVSEYQYTGFVLISWSLYLLFDFGFLTANT